MKKKPQNKVQKKRQKNPQSKPAQHERKLRIQKLDRELRKLFPHAEIALGHSTPWELLVSVILSAQCTDKKVNEVTARLFVKYPTFESYLTADPAEFERDIHQTGFFRSKTKHVLGAARRIQDVYDGKVPDTMEELLTLPGVARKTANIVLGTVYGVVEGIAVDTHVKRFAIRFDLTDSTNPERIEQDLMAIVPKKDWYEITYRIIEYGRQIAPARTYDITKDPLIAVYPPAGNIFRV
jgi:endonuclease-3